MSLRDFVKFGTRDEWVGEILFVWLPFDVKKAYISKHGDWYIFCILSVSPSTYYISLAYALTFSPDNIPSPSSLNICDQDRHDLCTYQLHKSSTPLLCHEALTSMTQEYEQHDQFYAMRLR
jgi:hypothetical protein